MKKTFSLISTIALSALIYGQTLNQTQYINTPGSADNFRGGYTFAYSPSGTPWNGSLLSFGGLSNRYDTQLSADYGPNGGSHISFRTRNGDHNAGVGMWNSWNEIWHSSNLNNATSDFTSRNLSINGNLNITANGDAPIIRGNGGYIPSGLRFIDDSYNQQGQVKEWAIWKGNGWRKGLGFMRYDALNRCAGGICDIPLMLYDNGAIEMGITGQSVGILSKLYVEENMKVNAKLEAKEVRVTTTPNCRFRI